MLQTEVVITAGIRDVHTTGLVIVCSFYSHPNMPDLP
jgi:hypothetical protein